MAEGRQGDVQFLRDRVFRMEEELRELKRGIQEDGLKLGEAQAILEACREFFRIYPQHGKTLLKTIELVLQEVA